MIQLDSVKKFYGERLIFRDVSFRIFDGEHVGIVGKNGAGKSTLVKIMTGAENFDDGTVSGLRAEDIGFVEQTPHFTAATLLDEMLTVGNGVEKFQARKILFGLGFTDGELEKNPNHFSGGESAKISLAKALLNEPRILILDEPTNHLDIYAIEFLEDFVRNYRGTLIAVTHDRHFLQNCVEKILDMENFSATMYPGNYEKFLHLKTERRAAELKAYERQQTEIAKLEEFVRRNKAGVKAKQARGRQTLLDRMERLQKPPSIETAAINLGDAAESANRVLILDGVNFRGIIKNFSAEIFRGEKVGLIGRNGVGKSTLLKLIVGELKSDGGEIKIGNRVKVGYLSQGHEELDDNLTPLEELNAQFGLSDGQARSELAKLNLFANVVEKPVAALSGGEKTRVALTKLILTGANFLILDEPTNHLDLPAREAIEAALQNFDGTILIVTHDRWLLDKVTTRIIEFSTDEPKKFSPQKSARPSPKSPAPKPKTVPPKPKPIPRNDQSLDKIEAQIKMAEMELKMLEHEINSAVAPEKLSELAAAHEKKLAEIDELYIRWEELQC